MNKLKIIPFQIVSFSLAVIIMILLIIPSVLFIFLRLFQITCLHLFFTKRNLKIELYILFKKESLIFYRELF